MSRFLAMAVLALSAAVCLPAAARVETGSPYAKAQVYSAALRYLRVDLGYEVTEKDPDAAYLLFRFSPEGRKSTTSGSIQIVERNDGVRVVVQLPELPRYHEQVLSDGLQRKLVNDYGDPPHKVLPPAKDKDEDKGKDGNDDKGKDRSDEGDGNKPKPDDGRDSS